MFKSALDQPCDARGVFLDKVCSGNSSLRKQVEALLAAHEQAESFFDKPVVEVSSSQEEESGKVIGSYRVIELLGAGGMGEVYLAEDLRLGRKVALKLLPAHFLRHQEQVRRFQQEARVISALNHPNILTVYEFGYDESRPFIAAEFIEGETLRDKLAQPLSIENALSTVEQIANALIAAHASGIIHRDIKPENVIVREDGFAKVLDFGLAKLTESEEAADATDPEAVTRILLHTTPGMVIGTVSYMSPEQARGLSVDERTDIWSLGVLLCELITGRLPFNAPTRADAMVAILEREPNLDNVPPELQTIIRKSLKKDKKERYQSIAQFLSDLQRLKDVSSGSFSTSFTTTSSRFHHATIEEKKHRFLNKNLIVGLSLLLIVVSSLSVFYIRRVRVSSSASNDKAVTAIIKPYSEMNEEEKKAFIKQQAFHISDMMSEHTTELSDEAIRTIKQYVDFYVARADNNSTKAFHESLSIIYERAAQYAPSINRAFKERDIPSIVGLYVAMIEAEYKQCEESPSGSKGAFQFRKETAANYNLNWEDVCNIEKAAPAAARYIEDSIVDFGDDSKSMTLVLLSFNRGGQAVRDDLRMLRASGQKERSFWTMFDNADKLDQQFQGEGKHYVPKFFAAAIIGENPSAFGLKIKPLSQN